MIHELGVDVDGLEANCVDPVLALMNADLGTHYRHSDMASFRWVFEQTMELTGDPERAKRLEGYFFDPDVLFSAQPYPFAIPILKFLRNLQFDPQFITTRNPSCRDATFAWFEKHFPWVVQENRLYIRDGNSNEPGEQFKFGQIRRLRVRKFYEDNGDTVRNLLTDPTITVRTQPYLFDQPWNTSYVDLNRHRVHGWFGVLSSAIASRKNNN